MARSVRPSDQALERESSMLNSFKPGGMTSGIPVFEDGVINSLEAAAAAAAEKIDPLEVRHDFFLFCADEASRFPTQAPPRFRR